MFRHKGKKKITHLAIILQLWQQHRALRGFDSDTAGDGPVMPREKLCQSRGNASTGTASEPEIHMGTSTGCPNLTANSFLNPGTSKYYSIAIFNFFF